MGSAKWVRLSGIGAHGVDYGGYYAGAVWLFEGPAATDATLPDDAEATVYGPSDDVYVGRWLACGKDATGDDLPDLLVGTTFDDAGGSGAGAVMLAAGPWYGTSSLDDATWKLVGTTGNDYLGSAVMLPGDLDGDGVGDVIVSARNYGTYAGSVALILGGGL